MDHKQENTEMTDAVPITDGLRIKDLVADVIRERDEAKAAYAKLSHDYGAANQRIEGLERELSTVEGRNDALTSSLMECQRKLDDERHAREQAEAKVAAVEEMRAFYISAPTLVYRNTVLRDLSKALATQSPEPAAASAMAVEPKFKVGDLVDWENVCCKVVAIYQAHTPCFYGIEDANETRYNVPENTLALYVAPKPEAAKCEHPDASHWTDGLGNKGLNCPNCGRVFVTREAPQPSQARREKAIEAVYEIGGTRAYGEKFIDAIIALIEARHAK